MISKVQQVLRIAKKANQLYPKYLTLTVASVFKKSKLRKGNGGWGDKRDHNLCLNVTWTSNGRMNAEENSRYDRIESRSMTEESV